MSEQEKVEQVLAGIQRPNFVAEIRHTLDLDSEGEPAVRVWVVVQDDTIRQAEFDEPLDRLRAAIVDALRKAGIQSWPFVHLREQAEQEELVRAGYAFA